MATLIPMNAFTLACISAPGRVRAIGKGGVLVSEVISGRGYPGVIIGGLGEVVVDLLVAHPAIRPFANTLAGQTSAMIQIFDAKQTTQSYGDRLEMTRQLTLSQASLFNSLVYLLRQHPDLFHGFDYFERDAVVGIMSDPHRVLRAHYARNP